jgi:hypothetical protein
MSNVTLIGLSGKMGVGKDTVANMILSLRPRAWKTNSFAKPLKEGVKAMFGWSDDILENRKTKEEVDDFWGFSPRKAMQLLGTEYGRVGLRDDIWVRAAQHRYEENLSVLDKGTIMTDVRFENEAEFIRSYGDSAILIHIEDPEAPYVDPETLHASELGIKIIENDWLIGNSKSEGVDKLRERVEWVLQQNGI